MVDGSEDGQNIPLQPLLVKAREVDVIIAIDAVSLKPSIFFDLADHNCFYIVCERD
jgi:hypothetical protein